MHPRLPPWRSGPPVFRALAAQGVVFLLLACLAWFLAAHVPAWSWPFGQGILAALLGARWGLRAGWLCFQAGLPFALAWQLGHTVPVWIYPVLLVLLWVVYGGGLFSRVPLYNSSRAAWRELLALVPEGPARVADLGAGLGGPLAFLARHRPDVRFTGIESSPLVWLLAWLRTWPVRSNCRLRLGSFWREPLDRYQVVYAFLSPAPMAKLWEKACRELPAGALFISNTFEIPGVTPFRIIPLPGRLDARLLLYRVTGGDSQERAAEAEN